MSYQPLDQEIKNKKDNVQYHSWRGDLSQKGLDNILWGDLKELEALTQQSK